MAGDVNMFFHDDEDRGSAEINVMIAASESRRRGLAREALCLMMDFAVKHLSASKFVAKISDSNEPSLNLFRHHLQFVQTGHSRAFEETTLERVVSHELKIFLEVETAGALVNATGYGERVEPTL